MCDIWKIDTIKELSIADLERHAGDIETLAVRWVVFSGGEPLMHSDLFRFSDRLRRSGIRTTILTTGLLLEKHALKIANGIDDVIVSLDGPADVHDRIRRIPRAYDLLAQGIRALQRMRPDFPISARCTVQRENFSCLRKTMQAARGLGLRSLSFLAADVTSTAFNRPENWPAERQEQVALSVDEIDSLEKEISGLLEEMERCPGFVLETPEKLQRIVHHFRAHREMVEPVSPHCNAPWVSAVVESDGTVRPCFFHKPIGNIREDSLRRILNSSHAIEFRATLDVSQDPVCRRCVCSLYLDPEK
jgi:MoaA/NifB/PqqE/SkfB family radical SAM enzyme